MSFRIPSSGTSTSMGTMNSVASETYSTSINHDRYLSSLQSGATETTFCNKFVVKLQAIWKRILNFFSRSSSTGETNTSISLDVQNIIDFGKRCITHHLGTENLSELPKPECKMAVITKLNGQIISQNCVKIDAPSMPHIKQAAITKMTQDITQYSQNHKIQPRDKLRVETYFVASYPGNQFITHWFFNEQSNGLGSDKTLLLSTREVSEYISLHYQASEDAHKQNLLKFMLNNG